MDIHGVNDIFNSVMGKAKNLESYRQLENEFTREATNMCITMLEKEGVLVLGISPPPTIKALNILNNFFPNNEVIQSVNCRLCVWEKCLSSNPWKRHIVCTTPFGNYIGKTFHPVDKIAYDCLSPTKCVLVILPHNGCTMLNWLKKIPKQAPQPCQYLAVVVAKDWVYGECDAFMKCLFSLNKFKCTKIFDLSNSFDDMRNGYQLLLFSTVDCPDKYSVLVPKSSANYEHLSTKDLMMRVQMTVIHYLVDEMISVRPLNLPAKLELLDDFPLFFPDIKINVTASLFLTRNLAMIFPSQRAVSVIVKFLSGENKVLSIGCGLAFWEYLISSYCVASKFVCTDIEPPKGKPFLDVKVMSAMRAHKEYPHHDVVCMCYPEPNACTEYFTRAHKPRKIVLIGNSMMGEIITYEFFRYLQEWYTDSYCKPDCEDDMYRFGNNKLQHREYRECRDAITIGLYTRNKQKKIIYK